MAAQSLSVRIETIFEDALYDTTAVMIARWLAGSMHAASSDSLPAREHLASTAATLDAPASPLVLCTPPPQLWHRPIPDLDLTPAARVSRAPIFMDQGEALLIVAITNARDLLAVLGKVAVARDQASQTLLSLTDWKLNVDLQDAELLLAMAALAVSIGSARILASTMPFWQMHSSSRECPPSWDLTDISSTTISGKSNSQPLSISPSSLSTSSPLKATSAIFVTQAGFLKECSPLGILYLCSS